MSAPVQLLLPEDVPGALFKDNYLIEDHSVAELQRWLECRGYKKIGSKEQLIERIKNCIKNGEDKKISPGIDNGKWYDLKRNLIQDAQSSRQNDHLQLMTTRVKWGDFPSFCIPEYFNKGHIYTYIIGENVQNEDPDMEINDENVITSVKPFRRGSQYVDSDHISEVMDSTEGSYYIAKCKCQASFRKKVHYNVLDILNRISGAVVKGKCECKQSSLGKCSHVTAFLIFICQYVEKYGNEVVASTSRPRKWGIGSRNRNPGPTSVSTYPMKRLKLLKRAEFDPRPTNYQREVVDWNSFVVGLQKGEKLSIFQAIFKIQYENFHYSLEQLDIYSQQAQQFINNMKTFLDNFVSDLIEIPGTEQGSEVWYRWRTYFITSSNTKVACRLSSESAKKNFLLRNLWRMSPPIMTAAMSYGKRNEPLVRNAYLKNFVGEDQILQQAGLVVNRNYPCFAASVDGLVTSADGTIEHLIEIKCPKILEKCSNLSDFDSYLTKKQLSNFFLEKQNMEYTIKKDHPYLYQMIMCLIIFDLNICHLVVWNPDDILVLCVSKDKFPEIVDEIKTKLEQFYKSVYVPEMFSMRCVRNLNPIELN